MTISPKAAAASAAILWGFTYIVTTQLLPPNPMFIAAMRALGGGVILLALARDFPPKAWWGRLVVLGTLNSGLFFALLFVAAIRLPGGVAATFQALGPLFMVLLAWPLLQILPSKMKLASVTLGAIGVAMVVLQGGAGLDVLGVLAALGAAFSMALGAALLHKWGRPGSLISFSAWQMIVAGLQLGMIALAFGDYPSTLSTGNLAGLLIMAALLTALAMCLWFGAIQKIGPTSVAPFALLTPLTAFALDAVVRGILPSPIQALGVALVIASLLWGNFSDRRRV